MGNYKVFSTLSNECVMMSAGSLLQVTIDEVITNFNAYGETTSVRIKGKNCGKVVSADADVCFKNLDDFRTGEKLPLKGHDTVANDYASYNDGKVSYHIFTDGEPMLMEKTPKSVSFVKGEWMFDVGYEGTPYKTRQSCIDHNSFFVIDKEGKKEEVVGVAKLVALTDEQCNVLDQLKATLERAREINLKLAYEYSIETLYAFNGENVEQWNAGWAMDDMENIFNYAVKEHISLETYCEFENNFIGIKRK